MVIAIFAHRRKGLAGLLRELSQMNDEEKDAKRRARNPTADDDLIDRAFVNADHKATFEDLASAFKEWYPHLNEVAPDDEQKNCACVIS